MGQHFLVDGFVLEKIINGAGISKNDLVIEIGPGIGAMTQALAKKAGHVIAVELDKTLIPLLNDTFANEPVTIVCGDILKTDINALIQQFSHFNFKAAANLPYYITTPVIFYLLESGIKFDTITVMVQKEVAKRMAAVPGSKDYGSLTLAIQYYADVSLVANVPVNCFMPRPGVDSAVVNLKILQQPRLAVNKEFLFKIIKAAFGKRRKTLVNCLDGFGFNKHETEKKLLAAGINPSSRGETLNIYDFERIAKMFLLV